MAKPAAVVQTGLLDIPPDVLDTILPRASRLYPPTRSDPLDRRVGMALRDIPWRGGVAHCKLFDHSAMLPLLERLDLSGLLSAGWWQVSPIYGVTQLHSLRKLRLGNRFLRELPKSIMCMPNLEVRGSGSMHTSPATQWVQSLAGISHLYKFSVSRLNLNLEPI